VTDAGTSSDVVEDAINDYDAQAAIDAAAPDYTAWPQDASFTAPGASYDMVNKNLDLASGTSTAPASKIPASYWTSGNLTLDTLAQETKRAAAAQMTADENARLIGDILPLADNAHEIAALFLANNGASLMRNAWRNPSDAAAQTAYQQAITQARDQWNTTYNQVNAALPNVTSDQKAYYVRLITRLILPDSTFDVFTAANSALFDTGLSESAFVNALALARVKTLLKVGDAEAASLMTIATNQINAIPDYVTEGKSNDPLSVANVAIYYKRSIDSDPANVSQYRFNVPVTQQFQGEQWMNGIHLNSLMTGLVLKGDAGQFLGDAHWDLSIELTWNVWNDNQRGLDAGAGDAGGMQTGSSGITIILGLMGSGKNAIKEELKRQVAALNGNYGKILAFLGQLLEQKNGDLTSAIMELVSEDKKLASVREALLAKYGGVNLAATKVVTHVLGAPCKIEASPEVVESFKKAKRVTFEVVAVGLPFSW